MSVFFDSLDKTLDVYYNYKKSLSVGDFNTEIEETYLDNVLYQHETDKCK